MFIDTVENFISKVALTVACLSHMDSELSDMLSQW